MSFPLHPNRPMSPILAVLVISLVAGTCHAEKSARGTSSRPNIVLIMADDLGYECVGANGGTSYRTPVLDRLAKTGMRFENCHSQPLCTPSRVQLMTGLYNQRNYIRFGLLDPKATTFAHLLKKAGYATCIAGKWQLSGGFEGPKHFGFDEYCLWQLTVRRSRYPNPVLERDGKVIPYNKGEYGPDIVSDIVCDFIERNKDRPFFAYYPMILPHWPFEPTPASPDWDPKAKGVLKGQGKKQYFADMVAYTDRMVGKVLARLDKLGLRENTLVLFTGDNGTAVGITSRMGDRLVHGGKGKTIDTGTHVPLIARWPGKIPEGKVCRDLVDFTDFLPTLLEVGGAEAPKGLDGRSFLPQLLGKKGNPREWIYCWYSRNGGPKGAEFARDQRFKLYTNGNLFDVTADIDEKSPLGDGRLTPEARAARKKLQAALDRHKGTRHIPSAEKSGAAQQP
jgi:arylsulfatase A